MEGSGLFLQTFSGDAMCFLPLAGMLRNSATHAKTYQLELDNAHVNAQKNANGLILLDYTCY